MRRGTTLVELILAIALAAALTIGCATLYGFVSTRLMVDGTNAAVVNQANRLADELTLVIGQSRLCTLVTSGSITALRCHLPSTGTDFNQDGLVDRPAPSATDPAGWESMSTGNYVWFYFSNSTGTWGSSGSFFWRATPTTTANPSAGNLDSAFALYYNGGKRWNFIDSVTYSVDPAAQTTTFTISASSLNRAERSAAALSPSAESSQITITRTVQWRYARNLVTNPSFELPNLGGGSGLTRMMDDEVRDGWETINDGFDIHRGGSSYTPHSGNQILDCASDYNSGARQRIATAAGKTYVLSFYYSPRPSIADNTLEVWWNNSLLDTLNGVGAGWVLKTYTVTATTGPTTLEFRDASASDAFTGLVDTVSLLEY